MLLKNLATNEIISLPDDLLWQDEHAWSPAVMSQNYLITGSLFIQSAVRQAGRPITLVGADDMAWVKRAIVEKLRQWATAPLTDTSGQFLLTFSDGRSFTVAFRNFETAIEAEPVLGFPARSNDDFYKITLRFMEIS